ncbi:MAG: hypothetical protein J6O09_02065 [Lachnospiraceae bacterium]|nr:hypothetical protein [Lachnospiraceae bacterium]
MNRKIALINDMKKYNRMSYLNSVSILSAFGDRAYIGIDENEKYDAFISSYIENSDKMIEYREMIADAKLDNPRVLYLCDPSFADNGVLYDGITLAHIENYKKLIEISDIMTPNFTEAMMLTNMSYEDNVKKYNIIKYENDNKEKVDTLSRKIIESLFPLLEKLRFKKNQITIITGIELYNAVLTLLDVFDGDHGKRQTTCNYSEKVEDRYGVGDVFDAVFFEASTNGFNLVDSLSAATSIVNNSLRYSRDRKIRKELGIFFEPILHDNIEVMRKKILEKQKNNEGKEV